jgi:hypothetical protein
MYLGIVKAFIANDSAVILLPQRCTAKCVKGMYLRDGSVNGIQSACTRAYATVAIAAFPPNVSLKRKNIAEEWIMLCNVKRSFEQKTRNEALR